MTTFNKKFDELVKITLAEESQNQQNLLEESQNMNKETDADYKVQMVDEPAKSQEFFQDNNNDNNNNNNNNDAPLGKRYTTTRIKV